MHTLFVSRGALSVCFQLVKRRWILSCVSVGSLIMSFLRYPALHTFFSPRPSQSICSRLWTDCLIVYLLRYPSCKGVWGWRDFESWSDGTSPCMLAHCLSPSFPLPLCCIGANTVVGSRLRLSSPHLPFPQALPSSLRWLTPCQATFAFFF